MIDKDTAEQISMAMELVFREDQLVKAYLLEEGKRQDRELLSSEQFDFTAPFQYLGKLSKTNPAFAWLPFDLHIAAPIYLNFNQLFIDYSAPNHPEVVNLDELRETAICIFFLSRSHLRLFLT